MNFSNFVRRLTLWPLGASVIVGGYYFHKERSDRACTAEQLTSITPLRGLDHACCASTSQTQSSSFPPSSIVNQSPIPTLRLKTVQVFFRHGARMPLHHVPGLKEAVYDKRFIITPVTHTEIPCVVERLDGQPQPPRPFLIKDRKVWFQGGVHAGMLTSIGRDQAYMLGRRLGVKYRDLIGSEFNPEVIYIRSTNIDRSINSLECVLSGLFGHLSFRDKAPVVIRVNTIEDEILFPNAKYCPAFRELLKKAAQDFSSRDNYRNLITKLETDTDVRPKDAGVYFDVMQLRDNIVSRQTHGLPVPSSLIHHLPEIDRIAVQSLYETHCGVVDGELGAVGISYAAGRMLNLIHETMLADTTPNKAAHEPRHHRMYVYSCHDSTIVPALAAFGCLDNRWPPYASDISIELYEDSRGQHWVKMLYCDRELVLRGQEGALVTLEQFLDVIKPYRVVAADYQLRCKDVATAIKQINKLLAADGKTNVAPRK